MKTKNYKIAMLLDNPFAPDMRVLREARSLVEAGNEVTIYAWDRDWNITRPNSEIIDDIKIIRILAKSDRQLGFRQIPHYLSFARQAYRLIGQGSYDIVHCHDLPDLPVGVLLKILRRLKLVYDAHEIYWLMEAKKYPNSVLSVIRWGEFALMKYVDAFITVGYKRAEYYKPHYQKTISVVGNWYNPMARDAQMGSDLRKMLGISTDEHVLTYAGTLSKSRNIDLLIEIAEEFYNHYPKIHVVVAGSGPYVKIVEQWANQNPNLHFLGWKEDTTPLYSASDALIYLMDLSHPYAEYNSPNNLYISIAWGIPLIGINAGEISGILEEVTPKLLIGNLSVNEIASTVIKLVDNPESLEIIREQYKALQSKFNWNLAKEYLLSAYSIFPTKT